MNYIVERDLAAGTSLTSDQLFDAADKNSNNRTNKKMHSLRSLINK